MTVLNKTCCVCGTKYSYCPSCGKDQYKPSWMNSFHDENCKKIYEVVAKYNIERANVEEAREILDTCDLSNRECFTDSTKRLIDEIYETARVEEVVAEVDLSDNEDFTGIDNVITMISSMPENNNKNVEAEATMATFNEVVRQTNRKKKKKKRKND